MSRGKILGDGQYKVGDVLGEGAFSRVYRCHAPRTHTQHAVKVINMAQVNASDELKDALCREINSMEIVSARHSQHVVNMVDKLQSTRNYYIVMDLADGGTLMDLIHKSCQGLSHCRVWNYFVQMVNGLEVIHSANVVHRDIKPENMMLATTSKDTVKISDFGFACFALKGRTLYRSCGTLKYTAPEVLGESGYDGRAADVWSLGVTLYVMLFNCVPFFSSSNDEAALKAKILAGRYTLPRRIPRPLAHLLSVMLRPDPKKRWTLANIKQHAWFVAPDGASGPHPPDFQENHHISSSNAAAAPGGGSSPSSSGRPSPATTVASSPTSIKAVGGGNGEWKVASFTKGGLRADLADPRTPTTPTPSAMFLTSAQHPHPYARPLLRRHAKQEQRASSFDPANDDDDDLSSNASSSMSQTFAAKATRLRRTSSCPVLPTPGSLDLNPAPTAAAGGGGHGNAGRFYHHGRVCSGEAEQFSPGSSMHHGIAHGNAAMRALCIDDLSVTEIRRMSQSAALLSPARSEPSPSSHDLTPGTTPQQQQQQETSSDTPQLCLQNDFSFSTPSSESTTPQSAAKVDRKRFEKRSLLQRLSLVHVLICLNFFFIFFFIIVTGALRVLFDIDVMKWPIPGKIKAFVERLLTPPTEQHSDATMDASFTSVRSPRSPARASNHPFPQPGAATAAAAAVPPLKKNANGPWALRPAGAAGLGNNAGMESPQQSIRSDRRSSIAGADAGSCHTEGEKRIPGQEEGRLRRNVKKDDGDGAAADRPQTKPIATVGEGIVRATSNPALLRHRKQLAPLVLSASVASVSVPSAKDFAATAAAAPEDVNRSSTAPALARDDGAPRPLHTPSPKKGSPSWIVVKAAEQQQRPLLHPDGVTHVMSHPLLDDEMLSPLSIASENASEDAVFGASPPTMRRVASRASDFDVDYEDLDDDEDDD